MSTSHAPLRRPKRLLVTINKPGKEKLVEEILREIEGVEVEPAPGTGKEEKAALRSKKPLTSKEKQFMEELSEAVEDVKAHLAGKKRLPLAKDLLNEL